MNMNLNHLNRSPRYMRAPDAARYIGLSTSTLAKMRLRGDGPAYIKMGPRAVAYDIVVLDEDMAAGQRHSTSEAAT